MLHPSNSAHFRLANWTGANASVEPLRQAPETAANPGDGLVYEIVRDFDGLVALRSEWCSLWLRAGGATRGFQSFDWMVDWAANLGPGTGAATEYHWSQLAVVVGRRAGRAVVIWPLELGKVGPFRQLRWMGEPVSQYNDVLVESGPDGLGLLTASWSRLITDLRPHQICLRKVRADAAVAGLLAQMNSEPVGEETAPFLDLASVADAEAYETRYSAKARKNRRRLLRRLEERGRVGFVTCTNGERARRLATLAVNWKKAWLERRGEVSRAFACPRLEAFLHAELDVDRSVRGEDGQCVVKALLLDEEPVSIQVALREGKRLLMHVIAYDAAYEAHGVGVLHLEHTLRAAFAEGITVIDLLAPAHPYKLEWADGSVAVSDHVIANGSLGRVARLALGERLREPMKELLHRLPVPVRRSLARLYDQWSCWRSRRARRSPVTSSG